MQAEPQQEHRWLHRLVGNWEYESESVMCPEQAAEKTRGSEYVRSLGGLWVLAEGQGEMPGGGAATTIMTLGYDPHKQRFVGTWVGSMMTHLWVYDGSLDEGGNVLTLQSEGPSFVESGKMAMYRDVIDFQSDDHRLLMSYAQGDDGRWHQFMTAHYRKI